MRIELGFGKGTQTLEAPDRNVLGVIEANEFTPEQTGMEEVRRALAAPIAAPRLRDVVRPGERIAIITSDITRPCPSYLILPPVLEELRAAGCSLEDVCVVFALGSHRKHTPEEMRKLVGEEVYGQVRCLDSDPANCVHMGATSRGTPVDIFAPVANADRRICLGNIEYHYFAGYSGGAKAIMPGVSTRAAIQANHSRMVEEAAKAGQLEGNPVREDIEEVATLCPIDYIVNVVLDEHKKIVRAVAGHWQQAHRAGCRYLDTLYQARIPQRADIVVTCAAGFPKALNLYQAQKALDNAKHAVRDGGVIILVGSCAEGLGEKTFERWMLGAAEPRQLIADIQDHFELGGHKAAAIAMILERARILLVSDLEPEFVRSIFMEPYPTVQAAFDAALADLGPEASCWIMPYGGSTLPVAEA